MGDEAPRYNGADRRRCAKDDYCVNLAVMIQQHEGFKQRSSAEYVSLAQTVAELRGLVVALPGHVAEQIEADRKQVEKDIAIGVREVDTAVRRDLGGVNTRLAHGSDDFKEIFRRLTKLERCVLALTVFVGLTECGKIAGYVWSWVAH